MRRMRVGCRKSRHSHSRPSFWKAAGARFTDPAMKSNAPPTPIAIFTVFKYDRLRASQISCFGAPNATNSMSGFAAFISSRRL